jgi:FAD/FMN-containing dehydrogenase
VRPFLSSYRTESADVERTGTGEHGVGLGKKEYLTSELGAPTIKFMKLIKRTIDPLGLFNPGKVRVRRPATGAVLTAYLAVSGRGQ